MNDAVIAAEAAVRLADRGVGSTAEAVTFARVRGESTTTIAALEADLAAAYAVLVAAQDAARELRAAAASL